MPGPPRVQLSLKGRLLSEISFAGEALRIGRMRENDVVVNNLAVSRFHATLHREGEGFVIEDLGSENGTQLNGKRIQGSVAMTPGDVIQLGKYELRIVMEPGLQLAGAPAKKASDAWDSSKTYFEPGAQPAPAAREAPRAARPAKAPKAVAAPKPAQAEPTVAIDLAASDIVASEVAPESAVLGDEPDPKGQFAFGEDDLGGPADPKVGAREMATAPLAASSPEHTAIFDFGADAAPAKAASPKAEKAAPAKAAPSGVKPAAPAEPRHAGLIVQRDGKLHELRAWDAVELCAGRTPECELVLADAGVSRRHAVFTRRGDGYEVRDLDSVNGIYVNGQRVKRHTLSVGDVVRIESFELTFVLDHQPIGSEVSGPRPEPAVATQGARATQFSLAASAAEDEEPFELAPVAGDPLSAPEGGADAAPSAEPAPEGFEVLPFAADPGPPVRLPEVDLVADAGLDELEEKELALEASHAEAAAGSVSMTQPLIGPRAVSAANAPLELKIALDASKLSSRLRQALALLGEEGLRLPAMVTIQLGEDRD